MNKPIAFFVFLVVLLALNFVVGSDILGNFILGIFSAILAIATRRYFEGRDVVSLATTIGFGVLLVPYFAYLFWYAVIGAKTVPAQDATDYLVNYVNNNFIASLPSTLVGALGASIVDSLPEGI